MHRYKAPDAEPDTTSMVIMQDRCNVFNCLGRHSHACALTTRAS